MMWIPFVILAMAEGDDKEYMEWLYTEHRLLMYGTAWRYVDDTHQAEDVVSDSCVALIRKIDVLRELDGFALRKYIVSCVRNTAFNSNESRKRQRKLFAQPFGEVDSMPDESACIEEKIELKEELGNTIKAMQSLPEREKQIMQMKYLMNMENDEIAQFLDITSDSVRAYISRARGHIRAMLYAD